MTWDLNQVTQVTSQWMTECSLSVGQYHLEGHTVSILTTELELQQKTHKSVLLFFDIFPYKMKEMPHVSGQSDDNFSSHYKEARIYLLKTTKNIFIILKSQFFL